MRETKFRLWDENKKVMHQADQSTYLLQTDGKVNSHELGILEGYLHTPQLLALQFTGLKDKNGKEIYEGDIILYKGNKGKVFFNEVNMQFMFETEDGGYEFCNGQVYDEWPEYGTYEVIGNIYENPELMEDQQ